MEASVKFGNISLLPLITKNFTLNVLQLIELIMQFCQLLIKDIILSFFAKLSRIFLSTIENTKWCVENTLIRVFELKII